METIPETEALFENVTVFDEALLKEITRYRRNRAVGFYLDIAFLAIFALTVLWLWFVSRTVPYKLFLILGGYIVFRLVMDLVSRARGRKVMLEQTGGKPYDVTTRFYEDHMITVETLTGGKKRTEYETLKKMSESKNHLILISKAKLAYPLSKTGFTKGETEDFRRFMALKLMDTK